MQDLNQLLKGHRSAAGPASRGRGTSGSITSRHQPVSSPPSTQQQRNSSSSSTLNEPSMPGAFTPPQQQQQSQQHSDYSSHDHHNRQHDDATSDASPEEDLPPGSPDTLDLAAIYDAMDIDVWADDTDAADQQADHAVMQQAACDDDAMTAERHLGTSDHLLLGAGSSSGSSVAPEQLDDSTEDAAAAEGVTASAAPAFDLTSLLTSCHITPHPATAHTTTAATATQLMAITQAAAYRQQPSAAAARHLAAHTPASGPAANRVLTLGLLGDSPKAAARNATSAAADAAAASAAAVERSVPEQLQAWLVQQGDRLPQALQRHPSSSQHQHPGYAPTSSQQSGSGNHQHWLPHSLIQEAPAAAGSGNLAELRAALAGHLQGESAVLVSEPGSPIRSSDGSFEPETPPPEEETTGVLPSPTAEEQTHLLASWLRHLYGPESTSYEDACTTAALMLLTEDDQEQHEDALSNVADDPGLAARKVLTDMVHCVGQGLHHHGLQLLAAAPGGDSSSRQQQEREEEMAHTSFDTLFNTTVEMGAAAQVHGSSSTPGQQEQGQQQPRATISDLGSIGVQWALQRLLKGGHAARVAEQACRQDSGPMSELLLQVAKELQEGRAAQAAVKTVSTSGYR